ncbi:hypothetical protein [Aurantiacibacter suaedae]|uniref:hypothetical protein n=1 Tax=Aurantiacibacter suaedae TaxID=2545755 RepID=UPI0010F952FC|nr:hypothetical protein [Aurantiacibacter suaedae]
MSVPFRYAMLALLMAGCAPESGSAQNGPHRGPDQGTQAEPRNFPRLIPEPIQRDGDHTILVGWHDAPTAYSVNRILPDDPAFAGAAIFTVKDVAVDFEQGLQEALAHEGVSDPTVVARRDLTGSIPDMFSEAIDNAGGRYSTFIAAATGPDGPVRVAGFWLQTPTGPEIGSTFEMFVAPRDTFEAMGGWFVPTARYFDVSFTNPASVDLRHHGALPADEGAQNIAKHFGEFMTFILQSQSLMAAMTQQTLSIQQGLDQVEPRGLQDPMYKP